MKHLASEEDRIFRTQFESCEFPISDFDHRCHIRLAYVYLVENNTEMSIQLMREALNRFLQHHGVDSSKYHETLTQAWILAVHHFMNKTDATNSADSLIEQRPEMLDSNIMMTHYSTELLFSEEARKTFLQPNRDPIPRYGI